MGHLWIGLCGGSLLALALAAKPAAAATPMTLPAGERATAWAEAMALADLAPAPLVALTLDAFPALRAEVTCQRFLALRDLGRIAAALEAGHACLADPPSASRRAQLAPLVAELEAP